MIKTTSHEVGETTKKHGKLLMISVFNKNMYAQRLKPLQVKGAFLQHGWNKISQNMMYVLLGVAPSE